MFLKLNKILFEGEGSGTGGGAGGASGLPEWGKLIEALPEDIRKDGAFQPITSLEGLAKSYIHAQKAIGKEKLVIPDKHATPDDWKQVWSKLGQPEKLDDYKLNLGEMQFDEKVLNKIKETAHAKGILPHQLEEVLKGYNEVTQTLMQEHEQAGQRMHTERVEALKKEWGQAFDQKVKEANAAMAHLLPNAEDQKQLIEAGFGDHPAILKMLANAKKLMSDDQLIGQGDGKLAGVTPGDALQKARTIQGDPNHPYRNPTHPNHAAAKKEVADLYKIAFPE